MNFRVFGLACVAGLVSGGAASAHHSFAMFDNTKDVILDGTVKEFQWTNPHIWVMLVVKDPKDNSEVLWQVEGPPIPGMARRGWKRSSLKPGDKAQVTIHPLKNGHAGGSFEKAVVNGIMIGGAPS